MRTRNERGALSNRGIGFGLASLALTACAFGLPGHGGGGTTAPTTTLPATTTVPATTTTAATTTTTGVPPTTSPTNPCAAENPNTTGFPCTVNTGVHGVTFTAANTTAHNSSACTVCPPGLTWSSSGGYVINSCVTIDAWKITGPVDINATNGTHTIFGTEAAAVAGSCVKLTHDLFQPPEPGKTNDSTIYTGFSFQGHGPVYIADTEVFGTHPSAPGLCGNGYPCNSGFSYTVSDTNLHLWRVYLHGTAQGLDSDGYSEMHNSYARADRSDQMTINNGGSVDTCGNLDANGFGIPNSGSKSNCSGHGDGYFQDSGSAPWELIDHNTLFCGAQMLFCARDAAFFGDNSPPDGGVVKDNLFKGGNGVTFCLSPGIDGGSKPFPVGRNLTFKNNVFEINGPACTHSNAVDRQPSAAVALANNNHWCNNRLSDGTVVNAAWETGGCP